MAQDEYPGVVMRGADGSLYFIPNDLLTVLRVDEETADALLAEVDEQSEVAGFGLTLPSLSTVGSVTLSPQNLAVPLNSPEGCIANVTRR